MKWVTWFFVCMSVAVGQRVPRVVDDFAALISLPASRNQPDVIVVGNRGGVFRWVSTSTAATNNFNVIANPYGAASGRYVRQSGIVGDSAVGPFDDLSTAEPLYALGDSQTLGVNAAVTNYTSGGLITATDRYPNLLAASLSLTLNNLAVSGSSHSYNTSSAILRRTPINRFGVNVSANWTGLATLMIGYNNIALFRTMSNYPGFYKNAQKAFIARSMIDGWAGVGSSGQDNTGAAYASFSTTGTQELSGNTDDTVFPVGNPGTDQRNTIVLTASQQYGLELTNRSEAFVFFDAHETGGLAYVYTNNVFAGKIDSAFRAVGPDSSLAAFTCSLRLPHLSGSTVVSVVNVSGTNRILGIGFITPTNVANRVVIVGSPISSFVFGPPYQAETAMAVATQQAVSEFSAYPVFYADVISQMIPDQDMDIQDRNHLNISGNLHVFDAFMAADRPSIGANAGEFASYLNGTYTARASGTNLFGVSRLDSREFVVGLFDGSNTAKTVVGASAPSGLVAELGLFQDGLATENQTWAIRQNSGASPSLRFVRYAGGVASGVAGDFDYTTLESTWYKRGTFVEGVDSQLHINVTNATPVISLDGGIPKRISFRTNSVDIFRIETSSDEVLRVAGTDISGNPVAVPIQLYRSGQVSHPGAVTNQAKSYLIQNVNVGSDASSGAEIILGTQPGFAHRIAWASGVGATTNRLFAEMTDFNAWRLNARDNTGAAAWSPMQIDIPGQNLRLNGTRFTNTALSTFTSASPVVFKSGANLDNDAGLSGGLFLTATNITHWRIQETSLGAFTITRFTDSGVAAGAEFSIDRATGKTTIGASGTALRRIKHGVVTLVGGTATVSDVNVTADTRIMLTSQSDGGTPGWVRVSARTPTTSFTITSSSGTDTSTIGWVMFEP
jgi:hypothetical protein